MIFDSVVLAAIVKELNRTLVNGRVDAIYQPVPLDVIFTIRNNSVNYSLLVSADAQSPRIHLTSTKKPNPKTPPNFCMTLRKYLSGARFMSAEQVDFDRILHLKFKNWEDETINLIVEVMGKHSNVILVNDAGRILGTVKPVGRSKNRFREILPGREYIPPPAQDKRSPLSITREEFDSLFADSCPDASKAASWLVTTFAGISPSAARELVAGTDGNPQRLGEEFAAFFNDVRSEKFTPVLLTDDSGRSVGFYAFPSVQYPPSNQHERSSMSIVADMYYTSALPRNAFEQDMAEFVNHIRRELEARQHSLESIQDGLAETERADRYKQTGELILTQIGSIIEGADSVELVDYYVQDNPPVTVKLDPRLTPSENAEAYFKKYHKAIGGIDMLHSRLSETKGQIKLLRKVFDSADSITTEEQIRQLTRVLEAKDIKFTRQQESVAKKKVQEFDGHKVGRVTSGSWEILVGQNSDANDYLLTRIAKPNDIWLHVKASSSAHVVIRTNGKPDSVPQSVLHKAAELAAQHSASKHSSLVPVDYTLRKYVRKPKGAAAGKAIYQNEKTLYITPTL